MVSHLKVIRNASVALLAVVLTACGASPESVVEGFFQSVGKGEISQAQKYLSKNVVGMLPPQKLEAMLTQESTKVTKCGGIKAVEVNLTGEGEVRSGTATITYKGECQVRTDKVKLIKEDGAWKLSTNK
jgi:Domain of unknown function (DUF4878)